MECLTDKKWWQAVGIRMIKTAAETAIAYIGSAAVLSEISWPTAGSAVIVSAIVCLLMNLQTLPEEKED